MRKHILTAILCFACLFSLSAQNKTTGTVFIVNGRTIENFDGSQIVGKTIKSYVVKDGVHTITTTDGNDEIIVAGYANGSQKSSLKVRTEEGMDPIIVCDGKVISKAEMQAIDVQNIESITVVKDPETELFKKYCKEGDPGVIFISLKK